MSRRRSSGSGASAFGLLVIIALIIKFWVWIVGALALWMLLKYGLPFALREIRNAQARAQAESERIAQHNAELAARADFEHNALMSGDIDTGTYGQYQPPPEMKEGME